jgi:hypothetical protein
MQGLQNDLDGWLVFYNTGRSHQGYRTQGRPPWQACQDGLAAMTQQPSRDEPLATSDDGNRREIFQLRRCYALLSCRTRSRWTSHTMVTTSTMIAGPNMTAIPATKYRLISRGICL